MTQIKQWDRQRGDAMVALFIVLVLLLAGGAAYWLWHRRSSSDGSKNSGATATVGVCDHLTLSQGSASGAAGTIYKNAVVTNTGSTSCTLTGYPAVFMLDSSDTQVGSGAAASSLYPVTTVTLAPGGQAHSVVAFPQQGNFDPGSCSAIGTTLKLYVPGTTTALTTAWSDYSCPGFSATAFRTGAS